jgi:hypothetical protein
VGAARRCLRGGRLRSGPRRRLQGRRGRDLRCADQQRAYEHQLLGRQQHEHERDELVLDEQRDGLFVLLDVVFELERRDHDQQHVLERHREQQLLELG